MYALVINNTITGVASVLPNAARLLVDGQPVGGWVMGLANADAATQAATGWLPMINVPRPDDTVDTYYTEVTYQMVGGVPTMVWPAVAKTAEQKAAEATAATRATNFTALTDLATIVAKMSDLELFFADADVVTAQNQANNTALTAQQQNRFNKAVITEMRRLKNMEVRLVRALVSRYQPTLLDTVTDV